VKINNYLLRYSIQKFIKKNKLNEVLENNYIASCDIVKIIIKLFFL